MNLHTVRCEPSVCIENPFHSHVENEQEVKVIWSVFILDWQTENSVNTDGGGSHWQRWAYINEYTNLNLQAVNVNRECIRNPIDSHAENEEQEVKVIYGEYSY